MGDGHDSNVLSRPASDAARTSRDSYRARGLHGRASTRTNGREACASLELRTTLEPPCVEQLEANGTSVAIPPRARWRDARGRGRLPVRDHVKPHTLHKEESSCRNET
jgi:hypothetical protein